MSGIVSLVNGDKEGIDRHLLEQMTQYMTFSAPDGNAIWHKDNVGLGCSLLQVNSEPEKQPFSLDDRLWIVADARLDGRKELVAALQESDRSVSSECADVELIWHAYRLWDAACVERLQGDFVFIIWDDRQQKLFCARDQFGIAPFYYATVGKTLICSNTLNTIRGIAHFSCPVAGWKPAPQSSSK